MPWGKPNPLTQLAPKPPSAFIRANRYILLFAGILYGYKRHGVLEKREEANVKEREDLFEFLEAKKKAYDYKKTFYDEKVLFQMVFPDDPLPDTHIDFYQDK